jgi:hypothetical protein
MKLMRTNDRSINHIKALVHGDSGIGKTTSIGTLPHDQVLLAVCERSVVPLRNAEIAMIHLDSWQTLRDLTLAFMNPEKAATDELKQAVEQCKILVIDSLSEVSAMCIRDIVTVERRKLMHQRTGGKQEAPSSVYEEQMTMEDWGLYRTRIHNMLSALTHLRKHVIFTCLSDWRKNKDDRDVFRVPNLSGKSAHECPAYFDLVLHMEADETDDTRRVWRTFNDGRIIAKDASGVLDPFEVPDWTNVFRKILGTTPKQKTTRKRKEVADAVAS